MLRILKEYWSLMGTGGWCPGTGNKGKHSKPERGPSPKNGGKIIPNLWGLTKRRKMDRLSTG